MVFAGHVQIFWGNAELGVVFREICKPGGIPSKKALSVFGNLNEYNKTKTVPCTFFLKPGFIKRFKNV